MRLSPKSIFFGLLAVGLPISVVIGWTLATPAQSPALSGAPETGGGAGGIGAAPEKTVRRPGAPVQHSSHSPRPGLLSPSLVASPSPSPDTSTSSSPVSPVASWAPASDAPTSSAPPLSLPPVPTPTEISASATPDWTPSDAQSGFEPSSQSSSESSYQFSLEPSAQLSFEPSAELSFEPSAEFSFEPSSPLSFEPGFQLSVRASSAEPTGIPAP